MGKCKTWQPNHQPVVNLWMYACMYSTNITYMYCISLLVTIHEGEVLLRSKKGAQGRAAWRSSTLQHRPRHLISEVLPERASVRDGYTLVFIRKHGLMIASSTSDFKWRSKGSGHKSLQHQTFHHWPPEAPSCTHNIEMSLWYFNSFCYCKSSIFMEF